MRRLRLVGPRGARWRTDVPSERRERTRGLRGRTLDPDQAMLLERCRSVHTVGMSFPITVAFLDASWHVIRVDRTPAGTHRLLPSVRAMCSSVTSGRMCVPETVSAGRQLPANLPLAMVPASPVRRERDRAGSRPIRCAPSDPRSSPSRSSARPRCRPPPQGSRRRTPRPPGPGDPATDDLVPTGPRVGERSDGVDGILDEQGSHVVGVVRYPRGEIVVEPAPEPGPFHGATLPRGPGLHPAILWRLPLFRPLSSWVSPHRLAA